MPHRIKRPTLRTKSQQELLLALLDELRNPKRSGQPLIKEEHLGRNGAVSVNVIWDRWSECSHAQRYELIREAFETIRGEEFAKHLSIAIGLTVPEAFQIGALPYRLVPLPRYKTKLATEQSRKILIEEGASTLDSSDALLLAFETIEEAQEAVERLEERLSGCRWSIVHEPVLA